MSDSNILSKLIKIQKLFKRVRHQRQRSGIKDSEPGSYVQFNYVCKPTCVRCALEKAIQKG